MTSINEILQLLEEKLEDLQCDTKFCINNYDYHHKNNEFEIIQNLQDILKDSLLDGREFIGHMNNVRSSFEEARKRCIQIDEMLVDLGVDTEVQDVGVGDNCAVGSNSFHEEQANGKSTDDNKENEI